MMNSMYDHTFICEPSSEKKINNQAVEFLIQTTQKLEQQKALFSNNTTVEHILQDLTQQLCQWTQEPDMQALLYHPELTHIVELLPKLCTTAENSLEKWWLQKLLDTKGSIWHAINEYWNIKHYQSLIDIEMQLMQKHSTEHITFLSNGALPISVLLLALKLPHAHIRCVNHVETEPSLLALVKRCGLQNRVTVESNKIHDCSIHQNELVICSSTLISPPPYEHLHKQGVKRLIVRDTTGVLQLLYQPANLPSRRQFREIASTHIGEQRCNISRYFTAVT